MQPMQQQIIEALETLSSTEQQEVLDFAEFLIHQRQRLSSTNMEPAPSFLGTAQAYIGASSGLGDLSTNPEYMEGYGA